MRNGTVWGRARVALLTRLWNADVPIPEIAVATKCADKNAVIGKANRLHLKSRVGNFAHGPRPDKSPKLPNQNQCHAVIGEPRDLVFCCEPTVRRSLWCVNCFAKYIAEPRRVA